MTKDEALKLALEALETCGDDEWHTDDDYGMMQVYDDHKVNEAITAIKEALAKPAQEPVAWGVFEGNLHDLFLTQAEAQEMAELKGSHAKVRPLYTTPPQRPLINEAAIRADEREACAKVCDEVAETHGDADECATEIRARGNNV